MWARGAVVAMALLALAGCSSGSDGAEPSPSTTTTGLRLTGPGSAAEPIALATAAEVSEQWRVKVVASVPDAATTLQESRPDAGPPPGRQFFLATVEITYLGGGVASPQYSLTFSALDGAGTFYRGSADCGALPAPVPADDVVSGTTSVGNVCWVGAARPGGVVDDGGRGRPAAQRQGAFRPALIRGQSASPAGAGARSTSR